MRITRHIVNAPVLQEVSRPRRLLDEIVMRPQNKRRMAYPVPPIGARPAAAALGVIAGVETSRGTSSP